jgi:hypothetical protein
LVAAIPRLGAELGAQALSDTAKAVLAQAANEVLVNALATGASILTADLAQALGLPSWAVNLASLGIGVTIGVVGTVCVIRDGSGKTIGEVDLTDNDIVVKDGEVTLQPREDLDPTAHMDSPDRDPAKFRVDTTDSDGVPTDESDIAAPHPVDDPIATHDVKPPEGGPTRITDDGPDDDAKPISETDITKNTDGVLSLDQAAHVAALKRLIADDKVNPATRAGIQ